MARLLYLFRHAKSSWSDSDLADRDRPLAPRGKRAAQAMAKYIESQGVRPALVLCSPARRARQTLELVAPALGEPDVLVEDELYGASADGLLDRLRRLPAALPSAMVVGHNPGLQDLASLLARDAKARAQLEERFPTGVLVTLATDWTWDQLGPGACELLAYVEPRSLGERR